MRTGWRWRWRVATAFASRITCSAALVAAIPKQYCCLLGNRSMLQHTLERMNKLTPASRTLTVIGTHHGDIAAPQLLGRCDHVFRQPSSRDTGIALYVALAMIKRWTPNAIVTITPTDHYVAPARSTSSRSAQLAASRHGCATRS